METHTMEERRKRPSFKKWKPLWGNWAEHPRNKLIKLRAAAPNVIELKFEHQPGIHAASWGTSISKWIFDAPQFNAPAARWLLYSVETHVNSEGKFSTSVFFSKGPPLEHH